MKIGITITNLEEYDNIDNIYTSGFNQHIFMLYYYLIKKTDNTFFISNTNSKKNNYKFIMHNDYVKLAKLDIILVVGLPINIKKIKLINKNVKNIFYNMGSMHVVDVYSMLNLDKKRNIKSTIYNYDEVWIYPHFEYCIDYYKYKYKTKKVYVVPFFWEPRYLQININQIKQVEDKLSNTRNIDIAVFEPNIYKEKACFIPIIACEFAKDYITTAKIFNSQKLNNQSIKTFFNLSDLYKQGKLSAEQRYGFSFIMSKYCNIVLSYVENCDLNFLFSECFYLGIPLIHNSKILKDYGYYYEGCNAEQAAEHIKNIKINGFNREEYIDKHKEVVYKYSLENPEVTGFFKERLNII